MAEDIVEELETDAVKGAWGPGTSTGRFDSFSTLYGEQCIFCWETQPQMSSTRI
jgi:hypothetical protein